MLNSKYLTCALISLAALCGCQSLPQPQNLAPQAPDLELQKREPNLTQRLLKTLSPSQPTATPPSVTSTNASTPTRP